MDEEYKPLTFEKFEELRLKLLRWLHIKQITEGWNSLAEMEEFDPAIFCAVRFYRELKYRIEQEHHPASAGAESEE